MPARCRNDDFRAVATDGVKIVFAAATYRADRQGDKPHRRRGGPHSPGPDQAPNLRHIELPEGHSSEGEDRERAPVDPA